MSEDNAFKVRCGQCGSWVTTEQALRGPYAPDERRPPQTDQGQSVAPPAVRSDHDIVCGDPMVRALEGATWAQIGAWLTNTLPPGQLRRYVRYTYTRLIESEEYNLSSGASMSDAAKASILSDPSVRPLASDYDVGKMVEEISRLQADVHGYQGYEQVAVRGTRIKELENTLANERQANRGRDNLLCERIKRAEARIAELEAEDRPALIGQRDAWRDVATRLHDILRNR